MFAVQAALPKFPVAPLEQTMEKYLQTVKPLLTEDEFKNTKRVNFYFSLNQSKINNSLCDHTSRDGYFFSLKSTDIFSLKRTIFFKEKY